MKILEMRPFAVTGILLAWGILLVTARVVASSFAVEVPRGAAVTLVTPSEVEVTLGASVTVAIPSVESYGKEVIASSNTQSASRALGAPDGRGAGLQSDGEVVIELDKTVHDCGEISLWVAGKGSGTISFNLYASPDGAGWTHFGSRGVDSAEYSRYNFEGAFGTVKYLRVVRDSSRKSTLYLDAVLAESGGN